MSFAQRRREKSKGAKLNQILPATDEISRHANTIQTMIAVSLRFRIFVCLAILTFAHQAVSIQLPSGAPATLGMSAERLARMDQVIQASIEKKELPGAVVVVARNGPVAW